MESQQETKEFGFNNKYETLRNVSMILNICSVNDTPKLKQRKQLKFKQLC